MNRFIALALALAASGAAASSDIVGRAIASNLQEQLGQPAVVENRPGANGAADLVVTSWQAAAAPAKTPKEVVARLNGSMVKALRAPDISARMNQIGFDVVASTPEEFGAFMKAEVERWTQVVNKGGIKPE